MIRKKWLLCWLSVISLVSVLPVFSQNAQQKKNDGWKSFTGRIFIVRHGQRQVIGPDNGFDPRLTEDGRKQAWLAGKFLLKRGFRGKIWSSPYRRTLETASIIAGVTGSTILLASAIQEKNFSAEKSRMRNRSVAELRREFPLIAEGAVLPDCWPVRGPESLADVAARVEKALGREIVLENNQDILLVSHGAVLKGLDMVMTGWKGAKMPVWKKKNWNCTVSEYVLNKGEKPVCISLFEACFLPENLITDNQKKKKHYCAEAK